MRLSSLVIILLLLLELTSTPAQSGDDDDNDDDVGTHAGTKLNGEGFAREAMEMPCAKDATVMHKREITLSLPTLPLLSRFLLLLLMEVMTS